MLSHKISTVFVVSLVKDVDRRQHIHNHFSDLGIGNYEFVDGVDWTSEKVREAYRRDKVLSYPPCFRCGQKSCLCENNILVPQQVGNWLSFVKTWRKASEVYGWTLICEDDVWFYENGLALLNQFIESHSLTEQPQLVRLAQSGMAVDTSLADQKSLEVTDDVVMSNPAYLLNQAMAKRLLTRFDKISTTSDVWVHKEVAAEHDVDAVTVNPLIATELSFNKEYARFHSAIHPKGIDDVDIQRRQKHIKRVDSEQEYQSLRLSWFGEDADRPRSESWLKKVVDDFEISLPDDFPQLSVENQKHLRKLFDDLGAIQEELQNASFNCSRLECLRLELLRLATHSKLVNNLQSMANNSPEASKYIKSTPSYKGLEQIDRQLEQYLDFDRGFYVELGANDGLAQSNTAYFEKERHWRGVLIEPILHKYIACKKNRASSNFFANCACVPFGYQSDTVKLYYSNLMTAQQSDKSALDNAVEHAQRGKRFLQPHEEVVPYFAMARTITSVLDDAKAPTQIDFLSLDVEGVELEVLKGLDFKRYTVKAMLVESSKLEELSSFLGNYGYSCVDRLSYHDYLFILND